jgi:hypothetical protein
MSFEIGKVYNCFGFVLELKELNEVSADFIVLEIPPKSETYLKIRDIVTLSLDDSVIENQAYMAIKQFEKELEELIKC